MQQNFDYAFSDTTALETNGIATSSHCKICGHHEHIHLHVRIWPHSSSLLRELTDEAQALEIFSTARVNDEHVTIVSTGQHERTGLVETDNSKRGYVTAGR